MKKKEHKSTFKWFLVIISPLSKITISSSQNLYGLSSRNPHRYYTTSRPNICIYIYFKYLRTMLMTFRRKVMLLRPRILNIPSSMLLKLMSRPTSKNRWSKLTSGENGQTFKVRSRVEFEGTYGVYTGLWILTCLPPPLSFWQNNKARITDKSNLEFQKCQSRQRMEKLVKSSRHILF